MAVFRSSRVPIELYPATSEREKISFNQLNAKTGNRIKYKKVDASTGEQVANTDILKALMEGQCQTRSVA